MKSSVRRRKRAFSYLTVREQQSPKVSSPIRDKDLCKTPSPPSGLTPRETQKKGRHGLFLEMFLEDVEERHRSKSIYEIGKSDDTGPVLPIRQLSEYVATNEKLCKDLLQTAEHIKDITESSSISLYLVNSKKKEIYRCPRSRLESYNTVSYKIGDGDTLAGYVAHTLKPLITRDVLKSKDYPSGTGRQGCCAQRAICVPIISSKKKLLAVMEVSRDNGLPPYHKNDLEMCVNLCNWISCCIESFFEVEDLVWENAFYKNLVRLLNGKLCDETCFEQLIPQLLTYTCGTLNAETCAYYLHSPIAGEEETDFIVTMFAQNIDHQYTKKINFGLNSVRTVVGKAIIENDVVSVGRAEILKNYNTSIYQPMNIRSAIAAPLWAAASNRGAIELINKIDNDEFTETDMRILYHVSTFCEFALSRFLYQKNTERLDYYLSSFYDTLTRNLEPCIHNKLAMEEIDLSTEDMDVGMMKSPKDYQGVISRLDQLFVACVPRLLEKPIDKRHRFFLMVINATMITPLTDIRKVLASVEFIADVLKSYSDTFTTTEAEVMMISALCYCINCPRPQQEDVRDKTLCEPFTEQSKPTKYTTSFYFLKIIFKKSELFEPEELDNLSTHFCVLMEACHSYKVNSLKEELVKLLARKELRMKNMKHRHLMRIILMVVAGYAMYLESPTYTTTILLNVLIEIKSGIDKAGILEYDVLKYVKSCKDMASFVEMHLRLTVLPWLIIARTTFPKLSNYVIKCQSTIKDWVKIKNGNMSKYWIGDKSGSQCESLMSSYMEGRGPKKGTFMTDY